MRARRARAAATHGSFLRLTCTTNDTLLTRAPRTRWRRPTPPTRPRSVRQRAARPARASQGPRARGHDTQRHRTGTHYEGAHALPCYPPNPAPRATDIRELVLLPPRVPNPLSREGLRSLPAGDSRAVGRRQGSGASRATRGASGGRCNRGVRRHGRGHAGKRDRGGRRSAGVLSRACSDRQEGVPRRTRRFPSRLAVEETHLLHMLDGVRALPPRARVLSRRWSVRAHPYASCSGSSRSLL